jgi:4-hydroxyphenylpyruvate dioxygenase-like putative hemolysin
VAIVLRLVQCYQHSKKQEFMVLEKQFAELEHRGILPRGERLIPISSRDPGNTVIWQARFENLGAAEAALKLFETNPEHTALANQQKRFFESTWVEFYEIMEC